jgi:hypothetical protein
VVPFSFSCARISREFVGWEDILPERGGLPVAVDIDVPYTFSTNVYAQGSTHVVKAIARPLYADKTLGYENSMNIIVGGSATVPNPPSNLRIIN